MQCKNKPLNVLTVTKRKTPLGEDKSCLTVQQKLLQWKQEKSSLTPYNPFHYPQAEVSSTFSNSKHM